MLAYLSGAITAKNGRTVEQHVQSAVHVYFELMRHDGVNILCPHLSALFPEASHIDYERWMSYCFALIDVCSHVVMLPLWEQSAGAVRERDYALKQLKIVTTLADFRLTLAKR